VAPTAPAILLCIHLQHLWALHHHHRQRSRAGADCTAASHARQACMSDNLQAGRRQERAA
jgi:hypothetical protein